MKKLDLFKQDILRLLKSVEPQTLTFQGIKEQLASKHESRYKDSRVYGSALTYHLNWLLGKKLIGKNEETLLWGTPNAHFNREKSKTPVIIPLLSGVILTAFGILIMVGLKTEAYRVTPNVWNSTLTKQINKIATAAFRRPIFSLIPFIFI